MADLTDDLLNAPVPTPNLLQKIKDAGMELSPAQEKELAAQLTPAAEPPPPAPADPPAPPPTPPPTAPAPGETPPLSLKAPEAPAPGDPPAPAGVTAWDQMGLDFEALADEFAENGGLLDESYAVVKTAADKFGMPEEVIATYLQGKAAQNTAHTASVFELVGGEENFRAIQEWAETSLPDGERAAFSRAVVSKDPGTRNLAVEGLHSKFLAARARGETASEPNHHREGTPPAGNPAMTIASRTQLSKLQRSEEYKTDPAYRAQVDSAVERAIRSGNYSQR